MESAVSGQARAKSRMRDSTHGLVVRRPRPPARAGTVSAWPAGRARDGGADEVPLPATPGRLWLCGKHFVGPDPEAAMRATAADAVVCLCEEAELADRYPTYVGWLRANSGGRAVWAPVPDLHAPELDELDAVLAGIHDRLERGEVLLVHCGAGIGRAGTLAAALLVTMGVGREDAVALVASSRPMAGPEAGAQARLLEELASRHGRDHR
jgi:protein-tyrosine phosphatase